jgi:hypothetical protein
VVCSSGEGRVGGEGRAVVCALVVYMMLKLKTGLNYC